MDTDLMPSALRVAMLADLVEPLAQRCEGKQPDDLLVTTPAGTPLRMRNGRRTV